MEYSSRATAWIKRPKPNPHAMLRLFCFAHAGGGAALFRGWASDMPTEVELTIVQPPGREDRIAERPFDRLSPLVEAAAAALAPDLRMGPFVLFGHSMGALVSYELARYLRAHGDIAPRALFVAAHRAPHLPDPQPPIHHLPEPALIRELRRLQGTPQEILADPELLEVILPLLRADLAVCETYVHSPDVPLACPILALGATGDTEVSYGELAAWNRATTGRFTMRMFSGNHFFLAAARGAVIATLTEALRGLL